MARKRPALFLCDPLGLLQDLEREADAYDLAVWLVLVSRHILFGIVAGMTGRYRNPSKNVGRDVAMGTLNAMSGSMRDCLADAIRLRRDELGLTQRQVAERIGCNERTVARWESRNDVDAKAFSRLPEIAEALETTETEMHARALTLSGFQIDRGLPADEARAALSEMRARQIEMQAQIQRAEIQIEATADLLRQIASRAANRNG